MTIVILLFLLCLTVVAIHRRRKGAAMFLSFLALFYLFIIGTGILPALLLRSLQSIPVPSHIKWGKQNIILMLGAGTAQPASQLELVPSIFSFSRLFRTASAYRDCAQHHVSCKILLSGGDPEKHGMSEANVYLIALHQLGIPEQAILLENRSMNTYQNAQFSKQILASYPLANLFLITSSVHMQRSLLYFANFAMYPTPIPADYLQTSVSLIPNAYHFVLMDIVLHEYIGMLQLYVYNFLHLN